jgi:hypothetical protein
MTSRRLSPGSRLVGAAVASTRAWPGRSSQFARNKPQHWSPVMQSPAPADDVYYRHHDHHDHHHDHHGLTGRS